MKETYKKIMFIVLAMLCACVSAFAQSGSSCQNPILLGRDYEATISGPGSVWYVANTFDLPLTVRFFPTNNNDPEPEIEMDFSCTPGVYDDPIVCSYFCSSLSTHIVMPHHPRPDKKTDTNGHVYYEVAMGESYRNMLLSAGISYNVQVFVKVTYYSGGSIALTPDAGFAGCMDTDKWLLFDKSLDVEANDEETFFVAPYASWKNDSVRYIWDGPADATVAIGTTCEFEPLNALDAKRVDVWTMQGGGDTANHTNADIRYYMQYMDDPDNTAKGGMFYVKVVSSQPGALKVERMPWAAPDGGATLLSYDVPANVGQNDFDALYAIPSSWTDATLFSTPTNHVFTMYVGKTADFTKETAIGTYRFDKTTSGHQLGLFAAQMSALCEQTNKKYLYIRFECSSATTITPSIWTPSECVSKVSRVQAAEQIVVVAKSTDYYGLYYSDWAGGDMTLSWIGSANCLVFFGDTCDFPLRSTNIHVIQDETIPKNGSYTIPAVEIADWAEYADADGYVYARFYSTALGGVTITTTAPEEQDLPCDSYDSVLTVSAYDQYIWRGTQYVSSGEYSVNGEVNPETDCIDTVYTLNLTILTTTYATLSQTGCDSVVFEDRTYTQSKTYIDTVYDASGNRTIRTIQLTVNRSAEVILPDTTICAGDFWDGYFLVDTTIWTPGTYTRKTTTVGGCDSVVTQTVEIKQETYATDRIMAYDSCTWINGKTYYASTGGPVYYLTNAAGCDSIVSLNLTIKHLHLDTVRQTICASELPYEWNGKSCEAAGYHNADTIIAEQVDTVRTLDLTVLEESYSDTTAVACDVFTWYGKSYTQSGYPTRRLTNAVGCDSIITLNLTIHYSTSSEEYRSEYQSYTWNGETYRNSGTYIYQTTNAAGCDSTAILHLTVHQDTIVEYFCPKSGIVEHVDTMSAPHISYLSYVYEKPRKEMYMDGVVSGETNEGANVDLARVQTNLDAYYIAPLTPVETINWRYMPFGGQSETLNPGTGAQWMNAGTISMDMIFRCGYRYYGSFTIGKMTEGTEMMTTDEQPIKRIENGQVVIIRNGKKYSIFGSKIE